MQKGDVLKNLILKSNKSFKEFSIMADIPYSTLQSILSRGAGNASMDNILKICKALGITAEELDALSKGETIKKETWEPEELAEINKFKEFILYKRKVR